MTKSTKEKLDRGNLEDHRDVIRRLLELVWPFYTSSHPAVRDAQYLLEEE
jgi:hypothetical protein